MAGVGFDFSAMFNKATANIQTEGENLQKKIDALSSDTGNLNQKDLLQVQYAMGQYNAKLEVVSSITKSTQDTIKSLAQRTG